MVEHPGDVPDRWLVVTPLKKVLLCYFLYALAFTLVIPAFPTLLLRVADGNKKVASTLYGLASCCRFLLEFFSSPFWGNYSDSHGRKKILMLSLSVMAVELLALGAFPSVTTLFATAAMSGLANSAMAVGFAIVTDLSDGRVTSNMGYFSAVFGLGFIVGPLCGSLLIDVSLQLCFLVAGTVCLCSLGFTYMFVDESCPTLRPYDPSKGSPLSSLRVFFANEDLRSLAVPYCLSNLCTGIYFIWVLYMQVTAALVHPSIGTDQRSHRVLMPNPTSYSHSHSSTHARCAEPVRRHHPADRRLPLGQRRVQRAGPRGGRAVADPHGDQRRTCHDHRPRPVLPAIARVRCQSSAVDVLPGADRAQVRTRV